MKWSNCYFVVSYNYRPDSGL